MNLNRRRDHQHCFSIIVFNSVPLHFDDRYSYVGEATEAAPIIYWGPHAAQSGMYFPVMLNATTSQGDTQIHVPAPLCRGSVKAIDRGSAYWAFRRVKQTALAFWDRSLKRIVERQCSWEKKALAIVDSGDSQAVKVRDLSALAVDAVQDWWTLDDELTLRYGDGWEHDWNDKDGTSKCRPLECVLRSDPCGLKSCTQPKF